MENKEKVLNLIGLAMRARKVNTGVDIVVGAIQSKRTRLIFIASDASSETIKKLTDKCTYYGVKYNLEFSTDELNQAIGKNNVKVVSINDNGFSENIQKLI